MCEAGEFVAAMRAGLALHMGEARAEVWFGKCAGLKLEGEQLVVEVPNEFYRDWLRRNFRVDLQAVSEAVLGRSLEVEFRVTAMTGNEAATATLDIAPTSLPVSPSAPSRTPEATRREPSAESPLRRRRSMAEMDGFVVGPSNRLAYASAELAIRELGRYSPLCLHGPTGVGKTHLLESICSAAGRMQPPLCAIYQTAEQFTSEFLEALHHSGLPSFRRKFRGVDLLVLDDVQFLAGKRATLVEVLHTIDTLLRQGRQVVLAADRAPEELEGLGPELLTRISGGMACRMTSPEFEVRLGIVRRTAARMQLDLPEDVASRVAARFSQHARQLIGAVHQLKAVSEAHSQPIACAMADAALADLTSSAARGLQLADIERAICDEFRLDADALRSQNKGKALSQPRALAMWLARKHTRSALSEIGSYFGRRSHTTVLAAQRRVEDWMAVRGGLRDAGQKIEDTIRRVEQRLRVG